MKPFNLAEALAGAPVVTRDGTPFTDVRHFPSAYVSYKLAGVNKGSVKLLKEDGMGSDGPYLFMAPVKRTIWVNIYRHDCGAIYSGAVGNTKEEALRFSSAENHIGTYPIEIEE